MQHPGFPAHALHSLQLIVPDQMHISHPVIVPVSYIYFSQVRYQLPSSQQLSLPHLPVFLKVLFSRKALLPFPSVQHQADSPNWFSGTDVHIPADTHQFFPTSIFPN